MRKCTTTFNLRSRITRDRVVSRGDAFKEGRVSKGKQCCGSKSLTTRVEKKDGLLEMSKPSYRSRIPHRLDDKDRFLPPLDPKAGSPSPFPLPTRPRLLALNVGSAGG